MTRDSYSARLVLSVVRRRWDEARRELRRRPVDAAALIAQCRACDVHPWVDELLAETEHGGLFGTEVTDGLASLRTKTRRDNLLLLGRAEQALELLNRAGVTPVALKGLDFLHRLYPSVDQRTIDDVDLLVAREELESALGALREAGWRLPSPDRTIHYIRSSHHLPLSSPGPVAVEFEIHWNLAQEGRYSIDTTGLFQRSRTLEIGAHAVRRLDDSDLVAHLLLHHFSHYFDRRLKWLVDLQRIAAAAAIDWNAVAARIREWGGVTAASAALVHLRKLAPELIPEGALRALPLARWRRLLTLPLRSTHPLELFRGTRKRPVQLFLAAVMLEQPAMLPAWILHRRSRANRRSENPLDRRDERPNSG